MTDLMIPDDDREFDGLGDDELLARFRAAIQMTVEGWVAAARILRVMERRGIDMARVKDVIGPLLHWLRRIAAGQLRAEVVTRFHRQDRLVRLIGALPVPDQLRLASDDPKESRVPVVVIGPTGGYTTRRLAPDDMTAEQLAQVFARDHIRSEAQQSAWLDDRRHKGLAAGPAAEPFAPFRIDPARGVAVVAVSKGTPVDEAQLDAALKALRAARRKAG